MKKIVSFIICAVFLVSAFPFQTAAAQTNRELTGGRVYEFTNRDARTIMYVSVGGGARYDYVTQNAQGAVTDYGTGTGRIAVRGGGSTSVSLSGAASLSVTYNGDSIALRESAGSVFTRVSVAAGRSVSVSNKSETALRVSIDNSKRTDFATYDCAVYERNGAAGFFARACRYTSMSVPMLGKAVFTAGANGLTLLYPSVWASKSIIVEDEELPAVGQTALAYGSTYNFVNSGTAEAVFNLPAGKNFSYEYIETNEWGYASNYGKAERAERLRIAPQQMISVSPYDAGQNAGEEEIIFIYPSLQSDYLSVEESGDGRLVSYTVQIGETFSLANGGEIPFTFRSIDQIGVSVLDYTYENIIETRSASETPFSEMTVNAGCKWTFTVVRGVPLTLWFPVSWLEEGLTRVADAKPAVASNSLLPGKSVRIENTDIFSAQEITFNVRQPAQGFEFDYMIETERGVLTENNSVSGALTLPPRSSLTATNVGKTEMVISLPSDPSIKLRETDSAALVRRAFAPGATIIIENSDAANAYDLRFTVATQIHEFAFDYMIETELDVAYEFETGRNSLSLPRRGLFAATNKGLSPITICYPSVPALTAREASGETLEVYPLRAGESLAFTNNSEEKSFALKPLLEKNASQAVHASLDFLLRDAEDEIEDYGRIDAGSSFSLEKGFGVVFTNGSSETLEFVIPLTWFSEGIEPSYTEDKALITKTLRENESLDVISRDKQYDIEFKIIAERSLPVSYDYVSRDEREIVSFGVGGAGYATLYGGGKLTLMPRKGSSLTVCYPADWGDTVIQTAAANAPPLFRKIIKPNERFTFTNRTKDPYTIQNSSQSGAGRYYTREGTTTVRIAKDERPSTGPIEIAGNTVITIMAATGADLEFWMPQDWVKNLIR